MEILLCAEAEVFQVYSVNSPSMPSLTDQAKVG